MKNILLIIFLCPILLLGQNSESHENKSVYLHSICGVWKYNYIFEEIKVFETYLYEFNKDNSFSLKISDHTRNFDNIKSELDGEMYGYHKGIWSISESDSSGISLNLVFNSDPPSNEFGTGIYTVPDTSVILPYNGYSYNNFHFSSGNISLITDKTFLLHLDRSGTPYKENPLTFTRISESYDVETEIRQKLKPVIERYCIETALNDGYNLTINDNTLLCECEYQNSYWINPKTNSYCEHELGNTYLHFPDKKIKVIDINKDGINDYIINFTIEGFGGGNLYVNYNAEILGGDQLNLYSVLNTGL